MVVNCSLFFFFFLRFLELVIFFACHTLVILLFYVIFNINVFFGVFFSIFIYKHFLPLLIDNNCTNV